jgi:hypothetical protein
MVGLCYSQAKVTRCYANEGTFRRSGWTDAPGATTAFTMNENGALARRP